MPKLTADIGGIETGFVRPTTVVQPSGAKAAALEGAAQVFSSVSNLAVEGVKRATTASMMEELDELEQQYIEETKQELTPDEQEEVNTFSRRIKSWKRKSQVTGKTSEFKTRAEAILREKINQFPGLADHYRRAASSLLGFNPEGAEASMMEAELRKQAQDAEAQLKSIDNDAVKRFHIEPGAVLVDPLAQMEYQAGLEAEAEKDDWKRLAEIEKNKTALGLGKYNSQQFRDKGQKIADDFYISINNLVKAELRAAGIPSTDLKMGVKAEHWAIIDEGAGRSIQARIQSAMVNEVEPLMQAIADAPENIRQSRRAQLEAPFKEMMALVDQKASLEEWENRSKLRTHIILEKLKDKPEIQTLNIFNALGQQLPPQQAGDVYGVLLNEAGALFEERPLTEEEQDKVANIDASATKYLFDSVRKQMEARFTTEAPDDVDQEALDTTALNLYEAYGTSGKVSRENFRAFVEAHAQEGAEEYISNLQKVSPLFTPEIEAAMGQFAARAKVDVQKRTAKIIEKYTQKKVLKKDKRGRDVLVEEIVPFNINVDSKGYVTLVPTEEIKAAAPELLEDTVLGSRQVKGPLFKELQKLQNSYVADLNNVVKTMSNVWGMPPQEAAMQVFGDTGWIKEEQQGEGSE